MIIAYDVVFANGDHFDKDVKKATGHSDMRKVTFTFIRMILKWFVNYIYTPICHCLALFRVYGP